MITLAVLGYLAQVAIIVVVVCALIWVLATLLLAWIARGEPDANGDPEIDAGVLPEDPGRPMPRPWRRG